MNWACQFCGQEMPANRLLDHFRLFHPADYEALELEVLEVWPDGELVVYDETSDEEFRT